MPRMAILIGDFEEKVTVSEMRHKLARALSKLDGHHEVRFTLRADVEISMADLLQPPSTVSLGPLARPEND